MRAARKSFVGTMSRGKADPLGSPKNQTLSFNTFKCRIHSLWSPWSSTGRLSPFHLFKDKWAGKLARNHSGHYSLKNLPRVTENGSTGCAYSPQMLGWCQHPFPDVLNTWWLLVFLPLTVSALLIWQSPAQADPSSLVLVTISWKCHLYYALPESPKNSSSPALPRQVIESAKETGKKKKIERKYNEHTTETAKREKAGKRIHGLTFISKAGLISFRFCLNERLIWNCHWKKKKKAAGPNLKV